jgi:disulfide bond formation protein DsbB
MDVDTVSTFFALLAVLGLVFVAVVVVLALVARFRGLPDSLLALREGIGQVALPLAFAVALTTTLGSLYMSEVANFPPCILCWYQRILMYPNVLILAVASLRRDASVKWYVLPLTVLGLGISTYHYLLERFPDSISSACTTDVPCDTVWIWKFHFLSIPGMAWVGFALITTLVLLARPATRRDAGGRTLPDSTPDEQPDPRSQEVPA